MTDQSTESFLPPSKRAARRILQRAFVLTGRDKPLRQHIREARFTILWILEDWDLVWTIIIDRGRIEFARRPAKHPDLTLSWRTASEFFSSASWSFQRKRGASRAAGFRGEIPLPSARDRNDTDAPERSALPEDPLELAGDAELRRVASHLLNCFFGYLGHVLRNPVDGAGESLL